MCIFAARPQYKRGHRKTASFGTILDVPKIVVTGTTAVCLGAVPPILSPSPMFPLHPLTGPMFSLDPMFPWVLWVVLLWLGLRENAETKSGFLNTNSEQLGGDQAC